MPPVTRIMNELLPGACLHRELYRNGPQLLGEPGQGTKVGTSEAWI
jgi:hypothetical protein